MVVDNFLCSAAVALFWFTDLRAKLRHARTANHHGRYPPDRISCPRMGRECVGPVSAVHLYRPVGNTFTHLFIRANMFRQRVIIWVDPLKIPDHEGSCYVRLLRARSRKCSRNVSLAFDCFIQSFSRFGCFVRTIMREFLKSNFFEFEIC
jgi:hypothetical protein